MPLLVDSQTKVKEIRSNTRRWGRNPYSGIESSQVRESLGFVIISASIPEAILSVDYAVKAIAVDRLTEAQE